MFARIDKEMRFVFYASHKLKTYNDRSKKLGAKMNYNYKDVEFICDTDIPEEEAQAYIEHLKEKHGDNLVQVTATIDGEYVDLNYRFMQSGEPFERIRRITGYLVGTLDRFNDGKRAEEHDRVKHHL